MPEGHPSRPQRRMHARLLGVDHACEILRDPPERWKADLEPLFSRVLEGGERLVLLSLLPDGALDSWPAAFRELGRRVAEVEREGRPLLLVACPASELADLAGLLEEGGETTAGDLLGRACSFRTDPCRGISIPLPRGRVLELGMARSHLMGIVNVTPDSFYAGSRVPSVGDAVRRAREVVTQGALVVDIGGESTRPGADEVAVEQEKNRVVPVIEEIRSRDEAVVLCVDTRKAEVAAAALEAGADMVNDVSAGLHDPELLALAAERDAPLVLMHMAGTPANMQKEPFYEDIVAEVSQSLLEAVDRAVARGVSRDRVILDPGIGFGKTVRHNLSLLLETRALLELDHPLLVGTSRKSFIGRVLHLDDPVQRLPGTLATVALAAREGAHLVRVHDVEQSRHVRDMVEAVREARIDATGNRRD